MSASQAEIKGGKELERRKNIRDEIKDKLDKAVKEGKEKVQEFLGGNIESKDEVKEEINKRADERKKELIAERGLLERSRVRRVSRRPYKALFLFPGSLEDEGSAKYKAETVAAIVKEFLNILREDLGKDESRANVYLPEGRVGQKILKEIVEHRIDEDINTTTAVYFYELLHNLYEKESINDIGEVLPKDDLVRLYALDPEVGDKLFEVLKGVAEEEGIDIVRFVNDVEKELREMGVGGFSPGIEFTKRELERLGKYWRKIDEAKKTIGEVYLKKVEELQGKLSNNEITQDQFEQELKEIQEEYSGVIRKIEGALDTGNVGEAVSIINGWIVENIRLPFVESKINEIAFPEEEIPDFERLLSKATRDMEAFLQGVAGFLDPEALGIERSDFMNIYVGQVFSKFDEWFEWDGGLKFKSLELQESILKILHNYFSKVGISSSEEWRTAIDEQAMAILTRAIRLSLGNIIRAADDEESIGGKLKELARQKRVPESEVRAQFKELISRLRMSFEDEVAAQAITHEGTRLILQAKLQTPEQIQKLMINFDGDRAIGVFGGFDKELIDIASRLFSEFIQFYAAQHGGKIDPKFFRAFYSQERLTDFPEERVFKESFRQIVRELLETSQEFRDALHINSIDELEDWRIERAVRLGTGRSMFFEARAPAVMGVAKAWEGFEDQLPILAFFGFHHNWKWGRGGENLETRLKWLFDLIIDENIGGFRDRLKGWTPSEIWRRLEEGEIRTIDELEKAVKSIGPGAERVFKEGKRRVFRDILREFSFADLISRAGWRMKILATIYQETYNSSLDSDVKSDGDLAYRRVIAKWGTAFLFNLTDTRVEKEIEEEILKKVLGKKYNEYLSKKKSAEKKKIFSEKKFVFSSPQGKVELTPEDFINKKRLFYEGDLFFWLLKRSPVGFLDVITRVIPELAEIHEYNGELVGADKYYFDDDFLDTVKRSGDKSTYEKILKFRLDLSKYWDGARFKDLQQIARAWYDLQKGAFEVLVRNHPEEFGLTEEDKGRLRNNEPGIIDELWKKYGIKSSEKIKRYLFAADFTAAQRLLYATQKLNDNQLKDDSNLEVYKYLSNSGIEGVIKRVIFGEDGQGGLVGYFKGQNLDFANKAGDKLRLGKENLFTNLADVWLNYEAKRVIPSFSESRIDDYFRRATEVGNMLFARNWGDNNAIMGHFIEALGKLDSAFKEIGRTGETQTLEEVVKKILALKGWLGGDKVAELSSYVVATAMRYVQEDWRARLPFPFGMIARLFLREKASLNRMIEDGIKTGFNDENIRQTLREFLKKGYYKKKHFEFLEKHLGVSNDFYIPKFVTSVIITLAIFAIFYMIKKAFEEEKKKEEE